MKTYYFDYNATTPVADEVFEVIKPFFSTAFGNPSSVYQLGQAATHALRIAREQVAQLLHTDFREIIFTSGATESNNYALRGVLQLKKGKRKIVTTTVEHSSVRKVLEELKKEGAEIVSIPVNENGELDLSEFEAALTDDVLLVSVMWANNETGVIFPIEKIAKLTKLKEILLHVDAVQAAGKMEMDLSKVPIDFLSLSAHKFYGPKGVGILYVRGGIELPSLIAGGHQERERRGGTENVPGIVGMGKAAELINQNLEQKKLHLKSLQEKLETGLLQKISGSFVNGASAERIPNTTSVTIPGVSAEVLIPRLDEVGVSVSSGSACLTGALEPSHVLQAMGLSEELARQSIRLSWGYQTALEDIDYVIEQVAKITADIRKQNEGDVIARRPKANEAIHDRRLLRPAGSQ